ncbi:hypothetical protein PF005_g14740 [Phytophthora fragariae]|uniref:Uncharacterized protein n=2 Tax=Phytophthora fragariae TaxID=53985 RepID=A0A6A3YL38_9STRA|nr:hypothetical protein PF011_g13723 [Phytophthora fragariae]KAE9201979.1 hypothetical protein PF005_g14740 [Phytophthora fragariae]KAE9207568.1 hypothetical protein PF004_g16992 [Phytophthora fragariae]KAE9219115.1 hypothetical protein PF002_g16283 [Phytophthora fragariae]
MPTTTEAQIIVRPAPDALRAAGPAKHNADADASTPSNMEEKPPAPASKKHLGDPEEAKDALTSKKQAKDSPEAKKTPASEKPASGTEAGRPSPASKKRSAAVATKKKKTSASLKPTQKTKKAAASSKPAPKKAALKKPAAKQLPKKKGPAKESLKTPKLPPKRTDVLLPGPHEEGRSPSPDPSLQVDCEESESDKDHEVGEVEWSPPQITDAQRVIHPGSPMSSKTVVAVARARALEASLSRRDDPPPVEQEAQVITNAGVDEGVPPELL